jgi:hypothetical protein
MARRNVGRNNHVEYGAHLIEVDYSDDIAPGTTEEEQQRDRPASSRSRNTGPFPKNLSSPSCSLLLLASIDSASKQVREACERVIEKGASDVKVQVALLQATTGTLIAQQKRKKRGCENEQPLPQDKEESTMCLSKRPRCMRESQPAQRHHDGGDSTRASVVNNNDNNIMPMMNLSPCKLHEESSRLMRMAVLLRSYETIVSQLRAELTVCLSSSSGRNCDPHDSRKEEGEQDLSVIK